MPKKILITGSESFIGKYLIAECEKRGIKTIGLDVVSGQSPNFLEVDIRQRDLSKLLPSNLDAIVHLAALSSDSLCHSRNLECFDINVMGTLNLIEAAEKSDAKQFIFASSEWVYGDKDDEVTKDEESPVDVLNLTSDYAISKFVSEVNLRQKYRSGFCPATILRFGIIYGLRKSGSAVEVIFDAVRTQNEISVGSLRTGRRFIHVFDIVNGILAAIGLEGFEIICLEGDHLVSLKDILSLSQSMLGRNVKVIETNPDFFSIRNVSNDKAKRILDWRPRINLEAGLLMLKGIS